jgi:acyl carrier protein
MMPEATQKLQDIFRAVFELPLAADVVSVRQISETKWDSLGHISLVAAIESEFGVALDIADALRMKSFQATQLLLEEKGL